MLTLTDKVIHAYSLGPERIEDGMEMVRIGGGLTPEEFEASPHMFTNINSSSPLKHDWPMLDGAMRAARRGQVVVVSPFTLSGAMAPATVLGAVAQQNAEFLATLVLLQAVREGAPVVYGAFTSNVDMKSGSPRRSGHPNMCGLCKSPVSWPAVIACRGRGQMPTRLITSRWSGCLGECPVTQCGFIGALQHGLSCGGVA